MAALNTKYLSQSPQSSQSFQIKTNGCRKSLLTTTPPSVIWMMIDTVELTPESCKMPMILRYLGLKMGPIYYSQFSILPL
jgi:hypothetical protein